MIESIIDNYDVMAIILILFLAFVYFTNPSKLWKSRNEICPNCNEKQRIWVLSGVKKAMCINEKCSCYGRFKIL